MKSPNNKCSTVRETVEKSKNSTEITKSINTIKNFENKFSLEEKN
jgi:hypothetical protein